MPSVADSGLPGYEVTGWNGFVAPVGTPASIIARLNGAIRRGLDDPDLRKRLETAGYEVAPHNSPDDFAAFIRTDTERWMWAQAWADWGVGIPEPKQGCIVVQTRDGGGHVTLFEHWNGNKLVCRGGNQSDMVKTSEYDPSVVIAYRMPSKFATPTLSLTLSTRVPPLTRRPRACPILCVMRLPSSALATAAALACASLCGACSSDPESAVDAAAGDAAHDAPPSDAPALDATTPDGEVELRSRLPGRFNAANVLGALTLGVAVVSLVRVKMYRQSPSADQPIRAALSIAPGGVWIGGSF